MDRGAWQTIVHGVAKSRTQLRDFHFHFTFQRRCLPMKMKTHTYRRHRSIMFICCYCCSVTNLCLTLCNPMNFSTPGFPVLHCLLEFAQTHVLWISDAIQLSHPLSPPSAPAFNLSQHQGLFQWVGSLYHVPTIRASGSGSTFSMQFQDWFPLGLIGLISLLSKGFSMVFSSITIQKYQFFSSQPSLESSSHIFTWLEKPELWLYEHLSSKWCICFFICCLGLS